MKSSVHKVHELFPNRLDELFLRWNFHCLSLFVLLHVEACAINLSKKNAETFLIFVVSLPRADRRVVESSMLLEGRKRRKMEFSVSKLFFFFFSVRESRDVGFYDFLENNFPQRFEIRPEECVLSGD